MALTNFLNKWVTIKYPFPVSYAMFRTLNLKEFDSGERNKTITEFMITSISGNKIYINFKTPENGIISVSGVKNHLKNLLSEIKEFEDNELIFIYPQILEFSQVNDKSEVIKFFNFLIHDLGINLHPDNGMENYLDDNNEIIDSNGNKIFFDDKKILYINSLIDKAFEVAGDEIYDIGWRILNKIISPNRDKEFYHHYVNANFKQYLANIAGYYNTILMEWLENKDNVDDLFSEKYPFNYSFEELGLVDWVKSLTDLKPTEYHIETLTQIANGFKENLIALNNNIELNITGVRGNDEEIEDFWKLFLLENDFINKSIPPENAWNELCDKIIVWLDNISDKIANGYFLNNFLDKKTGKEFNAAIPKNDLNSFETWQKSLTKFVINNSWFEVDEIDDYEQSVNFITRANGNTGDETPGVNDMREANRLRPLIRNNFRTDKIEIEDVDEWVYLKVYRTKEIVEVDLETPKPSAEPKYLLTIGDTVDFMDVDVAIIQQSYFQALKKYESKNLPSLEPLIWININDVFGLIKEEKILLTIGDEIVQLDTVNNFINKKYYENALQSFDGKPSTEPNLWKLNN